MYILLEGLVDISIADEHEERVIKETSESGRLFGMMHLGDNQVRVTSAVAREDSTILVISWQSIERVARFYPRISSLFFKNLSTILGGTLLEHLQTQSDTTAKVSQ